MSKNDYKIDEKKIQHDNVFSIPIVQYQTTNTDELNKELKEIILKKEKIHQQQIKVIRVVGNQKEIFFVGVGKVLKQFIIYF